MNPENGKQRFDPEAVVQAIQDGGRQALWIHWRLGYPIAIWRDDKVVWIPAEKIPEEVPEILSFTPGTIPMPNW